MPIKQNILYNDTSNINRFIAFKNPFRYRSYYYDFETKLYYLNSRYYDPELGRFINADDINTLDITQITQNGLNLYAYCLNNPVNNIDENGNIPNWLKWLIGGLIIVLAAALTIFTAGGFAAAGAAFLGVLTGASVGGAAGVMAGVTIGALTGSIIGLIGGGFTSVINGGNFWDGAADGFMWGAISGALSGGIGAINFSVGNIGPKGFGNIIQTFLQGTIGVGAYISRNLINKEQITFIEIAMSLFGGVSGGLLNKAPFPEQIFVIGGVEFSNFLWSLLKLRLPQRIPGFILNANF